MLNKFSNLPGALKKTRADTEPTTPDLKVAIADVLQAVNGFSGDPYPFAAGPVCAPAPKVPSSRHVQRKGMREV